MEEFCNNSSCVNQSNDLPIIIDTGASNSITPHLNDFVTMLEPTKINEIRGFSGTVKVVGRGIVEWKMCDYWHTFRVICTTA
jgi:hypothetical protein